MRRVTLLDSRELADTKPVHGTQDLGSPKQPQGSKTTRKDGSGAVGPAVYPVLEHTFDGGGLSCERRRSQDGDRSFFPAPT